MSRTARVTIAPMRPDDIPRVVEIDQLSFALPWSANSYLYELSQNKNSHFYVALAPEPPGASGLVHWLGSLWPGSLAPRARRASDRTNGGSPADLVAAARAVIGYAGFWFILDEAHISTIAVHPAWRGQGVGEQLLAALLERVLDLGAVSATLEVRVSNEPAQALYRHYAFEIVGRRKRYYRDNGEDALLMTAVLHPAYRLQLRQRLAAKLTRTLQ